MVTVYQVDRGVHAVAEPVNRPIINTSDSSLVSAYRMIPDDTGDVPSLVTGIPKATNVNGVYQLVEPGDSLFLDGSTALLDCGNSFNSLDAVTVSAWFFTYDNSMAQFIFNNFHGETTDAWGVAFTSAGLITIFDDIDNAGDNRYYTPISQFTWHHIVASMAATTHENKLYLDGALVGSGEFSSDNWASFAGNVFIGAARDTTALLRLYGNMVDPQFYNVEKDLAWVVNEHQKGLSTIAENPPPIDASKNWLPDIWTLGQIFNETHGTDGLISGNNETHIESDISPIWTYGDDYRLVKEITYDDGDTESEGDALLYQTLDDGEINYNDGLLEMSGGLATSAYLSLFGGNEEDDGRRSNKKTWWGNIDEIDEAAKQISRTQHLLRSIPAISANLKRIEDAASLDLGWMTRKAVATSITVSVGIPALNKVAITIAINADGQTFTYQFVENWRAM